MIEIYIFGNKALFENAGDSDNYTCFGRIVAKKRREVATINKLGATASQAPKTRAVDNYRLKTALIIFIPADLVG